MFNNQVVYLNLFYTSSLDDFSELRPLSYPETDLFLICFSLINPNSFENVKNWFNEIKNYNKKVPIILIGTKIDKREDENILKKITPISKSLGEKLLKELKLNDYIECSSKINKNIKLIFDKICEITLKEEIIIKNKKKCLIM
jgi:small GTP-binding protein